MKLFLIPLLLLVVLPRIDARETSTNFLLITVDDMSSDSVGVFGNPIPGITPNIDRLASEGLRFEHGHVTVAICQPCRAVWMTGRYPHNSGAFGFDEIRAGVPTLPEALQKAGYRTGLMAKHGHVVPSRAAAFDEIVPARDLRNGRSPELFGKRAAQFFAAAKKEGKPFFLMANSQDPHRPFIGSKQEAAAKKRDRGTNPTSMAEDSLTTKSSTLPPRSQSRDFCRTCRTSARNWRSIIRRCTVPMRSPGRY